MKRRHSGDEECYIQRLHAPFVLCVRATATLHSFISIELFFFLHIGIVAWFGEVYVSKMRLLCEISLQNFLSISSFSCSSFKIGLLCASINFVLNGAFVSIFLVIYSITLRTLPIAIVLSGNEKKFD